MRVLDQVGAFKIHFFAKGTFFPSKKVDPVLVRKAFYLKVYMLTRIIKDPFDYILKLRFLKDQNRAVCKVLIYSRSLL